jgi:SAM-dependent methyltransferase
MVNLSVSDRRDEMTAVEQITLERKRWKRKNRYYHDDLFKLISFVVPPDSSVIEVGCGIGDLLARLKPARGLGIDSNPLLVEVAKKDFPGLEFSVDDIESLKTDEKFDYVIMSNRVGLLHDVSLAFRNLRKLTTPRTRVVIISFSNLWEPILRAGERLGLKMPEGEQNWMSLNDIENMLYLNGYEVVRRGMSLLLPIYIPGFSWFINTIIARLPYFRSLCLTQYIVAKEIVMTDDAQKGTYSTSVIIPTKDEAGNIDGLIERTPVMGRHTEFIFVDGNSTDGTVQKIQKAIERYSGIKDIKLIHQGDGRGKGDAVRRGFSAATGDILLILDADLTTPPEELPKFYEAIANGRGELISGSRLVYPMEKQAMRTLNKYGNKFFSRAFTWLLDQRLKDTLCGTKVLFRRDYEKIAANRHVFGDFDPFGDFDLLFGAAKLCLKIVEVPVRYRNRTYGETKIHRFLHGWLLVKMCLFAARKLKFR